MRTKAYIEGVEIQEEACIIANKNVNINQLDQQIKIVNQDIKDYVKNVKNVDLVVCNPPFFKVDENSNLNESMYLQIARHEIKISLEEIVSNAAKILKYKGRFAIVHRPERLMDIIMYMKKYRIEPKRIQFVYPKKNKECNTILIEGMYQGKSGLTILPPLFAHEDNGEYSNEIKKLFGEKIDD